MSASEDRGHSAVIAAAPGLPAGSYRVGWARIEVVEQIRGPGVRAALPDGFDPLPGEEGAAEIIEGVLWWSLWNWSYPADAIGAARAAHPGVTWTRGREQRWCGWQVIPAIGVVRNTIVAVVASAPDGGASAARSGP